MDTMRPPPRQSPLPKGRALFTYPPTPGAPRRALCPRPVHVFMRITLPVVVLLVASLGFGASPEILEVGRFSAAVPGGDFPAGWKPLTFPKIGRHTSYALVRDGDDVVVKAESQAASSGLTRELAIDPKEYPVIQWRWKIVTSIEKSDVTRKEGDDYPARLYVTFVYDSRKVGVLDQAKYEIARLAYGQYPPLGALNYIWGNKEPVGTIVPNPYTDRARMIVVETGADRLNHWITEERNLYEDYKAAFGDEPPMISGVAIMTDTDNTKASAIAYYGNLMFKKERDQH